MENFLKIISQPDNVAIVMMLIAIGVCTFAACREIWANDRCLKEGKKEEIYKRMTK